MFRLRVSLIDFNTLQLQRLHYKKLYIGREARSRGVGIGTRSRPFPPRSRFAFWNVLKPYEVSIRDHCREYVMCRV